MVEGEVFPFSFGLDEIRRKDGALYFELLKILLSDRSRKRNIIWAADACGEHAWDGPICQNEVPAIRPRAFKETAEKRARIKTHGEVFTPFEVVSRMTNTLWEDPEGRDKAYLEISCGEAPFITSRYDAATGSPIPLKDRVGILDRKLQDAGKSAEDDEDWVERAESALKSVYGYEFQGDSLFIARANILSTFLENFEVRFHRICDRDLLLKEANVVSWNFWQMDGLTDLFPAKENLQERANNLFSKVSYPRIRFWNQNRSTSFEKVRLEGRRNMKRFYAVIGNPPFQDTLEGTSDEPIYQYFMKASFEVAEKVELITPAKFLTFNGKQKKETKQFTIDRLQDPHFKILTYEPDASKVFPNTDPRGGGYVYRSEMKKNTLIP